MRFKIPRWACAIDPISHVATRVLGGMRSGGGAAFQKKKARSRMAGPRRGDRGGAVRFTGSHQPASDGMEPDCGGVGAAVTVRQKSQKGSCIHPARVLDVAPC